MGGITGVAVAIRGKLGVAVPGGGTTQTWTVERAWLPDRPDFKEEKSGC